MARRREDRRKPKKCAPNDGMRGIPNGGKAAGPDMRLERHWKSLQLESALEYRNWCRHHGLATSARKTGEQLREEREIRAEERRGDELRRRRVGRKVRRAIRALARNGEKARGGISPKWPGTTGSAGPSRSEKSPCSAVPGLEDVHTLLESLDGASAGSGKRRALLELLQVTDRCRRLCGHGAVVGAFEPGIDNTYRGGLRSLASFRDVWLREPQTWVPKSHNPDRQFGSLARHLLVRHDVPSFLDTVWFLGVEGEARRQQEWFAHLGRGASIRTACLPVPFTRPMAHAFQRAPDDLTAELALQWAQIVGLGGDARLARAVLATRLCGQFEHHEFWESVYRFFAVHPMLDREHVGPIVDFIHQRKFAPQHAWVARGVLEHREPEQPNFSMKGRTPESLLRQVEAWHRRLGKETGGDRQWERTGIGEHQRVEKDSRTNRERIWTVRELLGSRELAYEGRVLRHCVASYSHSCASGRRSIWSVRCDEGSGEKPQLTVEVDMRTRRIVQARGKLNACPAPKPDAVMRRWAREQGLSIPEGI